MATTSTTSTSGVTSLDSTYTTLINYQIQLESGPLNQLQTKQSALKLQRAIYTDLKTKLDALRTASKALMSTDSFYSLKAGRTVSVTNVASGSTVISAAASSSAVASTYEIGNISLALADRVKSDEQEYSDQALSKTGTIYVGGTSARSVVNKLQPVANFGTAELTGTNTRLADDTYYVETQKNSSGTWEFRLVNSTGSIQTIDGSGTNGWQAIPDEGGVVDTGRGLTIDFGTDPSRYMTTSKSYGSAANVGFSSVEGTYTLANVGNTTETIAHDTITSITTNATIASGQLELGNGSYYVETQKSATGTWQFRLVDGEGTAAKIAVVGGTSNFTSSWQNIPTEGGTYSTGRGIDINFGTDSSKYVAKSKLGAAPGINYQAKGAEINVTSSMSLNDIASAINTGTFASGNEVVATVVNKQLVLSSKYTGVAHTLQASGDVLQELGVTTGDGFKNRMQTAKDATFTVNGLAVTRSQNSALTDVISGVTLNLASDAEGKSATLNIASDLTSSKNAINTFLTNFNSVETYLTAKLATTKGSDGKYTRGALAGDQAMMSLKSSLLTMFNSSDPTASVYKSLQDIGITINANLTASISDNTKLETALKTNFAEVQKLVDRVMTTFNTKLTRYTSGTASFVDQMIKANDAQTKNIDSQITTWNKRLDQRKTTLTAMYVEAQAQMDLLTNTQSTNSAWITSLYSSLYS